jgi:hypothetical protein
MAATHSSRINNQDQHVGVTSPRNIPEKPLPIAVRTKTRKDWKRMPATISRIGLPAAASTWARVLRWVQEMKPSDPIALTLDSSDRFWPIETRRIAMRYQGFSATNISNHTTAPKLTQKHSNSYRRNSRCIAKPIRTGLLKFRNLLWRPSLKETETLSHRKRTPQC